MIDPGRAGARNYLTMYSSPIPIFLARLRPGRAIVLYRAFSGAMEIRANGQEERRPMVLVSSRWRPAGLMTLVYGNVKREPVIIVCQAARHHHLCRTSC